MEPEPPGAAAAWSGLFLPQSQRRPNLVGAGVGSPPAPGPRTSGAGAAQKSDSSATLPTLPTYHTGSVFPLKIANLYFKIKN